MGKREMYNCEYVRKYYGVPACIGRVVSYGGERGVIAKDAGNYVGVNLDKDKPGVISNVHPTDPNLKYLGMGKIRKMTRAQLRYKRYKEFGDGFDSFIDFCKWDASRND